MFSVEIVWSKGTMAQTSCYNNDDILPELNQNTSVKIRIVWHCTKRSHLRSAEKTNGKPYKTGYASLIFIGYTILSCMQHTLKKTQVLEIGPCIICKIYGKRHFYCLPSKSQSKDCM